MTQLGTAGPKDPKGTSGVNNVAESSVCRVNSNIWVIGVCIKVAEPAKQTNELSTNCFIGGVILPPTYYEPNNNRVGNKKIKEQLEALVKRSFVYIFDGCLPYSNNDTTVKFVAGRWISLCLPSCGPGFESQSLHLNLFRIIVTPASGTILISVKINKKEAGFGPYLMFDVIWSTYL